MFSPLFGFGGIVKSGLDQMLTINVRYNQGNISLTVSPQCTICELKKILIEKLENISEEELRIILGGSVLNDDSTLQECGIGDQSMLHAFRQRQADVHLKNIGGNIRCPYFVYCKECKGLSPGKLRAKCSKCKEGSFVADRGPNGWHDIVIEAQRISGKCQNDICDGSTAEFYFKCGVGHVDTTTTAVGLRHICPNTHNVDCITCGEIQTPVLVFPCVSRHVICVECFKMYCVVMLKERKFEQSDKYGYTLPCPAKCDNSLIQENHHFCLMGDDQYARYKHFATEEFVLRDGGLFCPGRGCGNAIYPGNGAAPFIQCLECRFEFCVDCRLAANECDCRVPSNFPDFSQRFPIDERAQRARWERQSQHTIDKTTKLCPHCKTRTEKDGGCSHMSCTRCPLEWCWICQKEWNTDCQADHWFD